MSDEKTPGSKRTTYWIIGAIAAAAVVIGGGSAIFLLSGDDEAEVKGTCANAAFEAGVERDSDDNRMTASLEVQASETGERWNVSIESNGDVKYDETLEADDEGEIDAGVLLGTGEQEQTVELRFGPADGETCTERLVLD